MITAIQTGPWNENCYLLHSEGSVVIIDPGADADIIRTKIDSLRLKPLAIINTHAHFDHIGAVAELAEHYETPFYLAESDRRLLARANLYKLVFEHQVGVSIPRSVEFFDENTRFLKFGTFHIVIHHTPGHTLGSVCYEWDGNLFTGDTLLATNLIPSNLPEGCPTAFKATMNYLSTLSPNLLSCPGHGKPLPLVEALARFNQHQVSK